MVDRQQPVSGGHTLSDKCDVLMHKVHNPFMVFRIFVTQPSRLQHLECFEAQLNGLDPLVFYPCGEYQRIRFEVIFALSYAVM